MCHAGATWRLSRHGLGGTLRIWLELVCAEVSLKLTEAVGGLERLASAPICATKVEGQHKQWCFPAPLTPEKILGIPPTPTLVSEWVSSTFSHLSLLNHSFFSVPQHR